MAKGLTPEFEEAMAAAGVPKWYIRSCEKIQYLWPGAHSASRVVPEYRIAYCKIHYPLAFYAAFFSIHGDTFPEELADWDRDVLQAHIDEYERRAAFLGIGGQDVTVRRHDVQEMKILTTLRVAREMIARGYGFLAVDTLADERKFRIIGGKLMPSLNTRRT